MALLSLVLLLAACATTKPPPPRLIAEPEIVEVDRPVHVDLPGELTEPLAYPELPQGELTNSALSDDIEAWRGVVDQCNADRARIRDLEARSRLGREDDP